jgi:hypothetical protein
MLVRELFWRAGEALGEEAIDKPWLAAEWILRHHADDLSPQDRASMSEVWASWQKPGAAEAFAKSVRESAQRAPAERSEVQRDRGD